LISRELRVRHGYEKHADKTNEITQKKYKSLIEENLQGVTDVIGKLIREQAKEINRKHQSELAKTKKSIEQRKS